MSEWIKSSERAPTDKSLSYLVVVKDSPTSKPYVTGVCYLASWEGDGTLEWVYEDICNNTQSVKDEGAVVTHWMPYPELPEEANNVRE